MNVYEATLERVKFLFEEFENVYVSTSGGKDSGVCTHIICEYARKIGRKVGLLHIDIEAAYQHTMNFVEDLYKEYSDVIIPIWVCLPMTTNNGLSYYEQLWSWWDEDVKDRWVRDMPKHKYVINLKKNPLEFYQHKMTFENFVVKFAENYSKIFGVEGKTACVVGIRTQESLNRWRAIHSDKASYKDKPFTTQVSPNVFNFYPIYDWNTEDVWVYYGKFNKSYNKIYDLMYRAGVGIHKMRIDEPFGNESKVGLNLFRVLEPNTWSKVVSRVSGANFENIYNKKSLAKQYKLPKGHTWESFTKFLLETLPEEAGEHYAKKFNKFIRWWIDKGSPLPKEQIEMLEEKYGDSIVNTHEFSNRGKGDKEVVKFLKVVDTIPELDTKTDILTWKRMALAILKNDYWCSSLSFGLTKKQIDRRNEIMQKYKDIL